MSVSRQVVAKRPEHFTCKCKQLGFRNEIEHEIYSYLAGTEIDYVDGLTGAGFTFKNPNARGACGCGSSLTA